jgi:hypothetical protein
LRRCQPRPAAPGSPATGGSLNARYEALISITWAMITLIVAVGLFLFTALER